MIVGLPRARSRNPMKLANRIIALLLAPCLVLEPATATVLSHGRSGDAALSSPQVLPAISEQAIVSPLWRFLHSLWGPPAAELSGAIANGEISLRKVWRKGHQGSPFGTV